MISTPLSNFIKSDTKEVRIRTYYASGSAAGAHFWDYANIELAIDPVYEPAAFERIDAGANTNYVSDLIGTRTTGITASDNVRMSFTSVAGSNIDINFTFKNVKKYTGMNTILVTPEMYVNNASLTMGTYL